MRKYLLLAALLCTGVKTLPAQPQNSGVDTALITAASQLMDVNFSAAEKDSMKGNLRGRQRTYERMHQRNLDNSQPYPFTFNPAPVGYKVPTKQDVIKWNLPTNVVIPANKNELAFYSIFQLAALIKNKKITSVELTTFFIDRLKRWGDSLHCVINLTEDIAMQQARQADADLKAGIYHGPLHGIPYGLKDLFAVKGTKTTWGGTPFKDQVVDEDAFVYQQLKKAGAVLCVKLSLGALAQGDLWFGGRTRNPWNLQGGSSGSSAGSAAATAAGLLPFAIGTETQGSIVSPSNVCGATGLRPTFGSVSRSGAMVLSWSMDKIGPLCRSAEDAALVFSFIKGTDGKDECAIERAFNYTGKPNWKKLRIAYASNYFKNIPPTASQWAVIEQLKKLGAQVQEIVFPDSVLAPFAMSDIILNAESGAAFDAFSRSRLDDELTGQQRFDWPNAFRAARFIPAIEYINANRHRYKMMVDMNDFMKSWDVLIVPTFGGAQLSITNLTGHPALCFPVGFSPAGLPTSITFLGNLYDEATILSVAKAYQDATDFNKKHPQKFME